MTDTPDFPATAPPLQEARQYWRNAQQIGGPGQPSMLEAAGMEQQRAHATMAQTAALVSIAESLDKLRREGGSNRSHFSVIASALDTIAKDITKLRQGRR